MDTYEKISLLFEKVMEIAPRPATINEPGSSAVDQEMSKSDAQPSKNGLKRRRRIARKRDLCHNDVERLQFFSKMVEQKW